MALDRAFSAGFERALEPVVEALEHDRRRELEERLDGP
jgi:hypothetical protein